MKNIFKKLSSLLFGSAMLLGVGVAISSVHNEAIETKAADEVVYTLDGTNKTEGSSGYAEFSSITQSNIDWKIKANTAMSPWRIGGKNITNTDRELYSETALNYKISKIEIAFGAASNVTVNSLKVTTHDNKEDSASGKNPVASYTPTFKSSTVTVDLSSNPQSNKFFRIVLNLSISQNNNKYVAFNSAKFYGSASTEPSLVVTNKPESNLEIGSIDKFEAETKNTTNPVLKWSSSDSEVIEVLETGEYETKKAGKATITCSMTCDELESGKTLDVAFDVIVDYGKATIEEVNTLISSFEDDTVTADYYVTISGYITNLNGDNQTSSKIRMIVLSDKKTDEEGGNTINVFGIYSSNALREMAILNGKVTIKGKPAKFNGTGQLASPSYSDYSDDARDFADMFADEIKDICADVNADNEASLSEVWSTLEEIYDSCDSYAKAKLAASSFTDTYANLATFAEKYDHIVAKYNLTNFVGRTTATSSRINPLAKVDNTTTIAIIVVISLTSLTAIGGYLFIRKHKEQ